LNKQIVDEWNYPDSIRHDIIKMVPAEGGRIGSIGCGMAITESQLMGNGRVILGVDVSPKAISVAKARLTDAWQIEPSEEMPFAENSLDGLLLLDVLEHMESANLRLKAYSKMLKPGGWVVISVPNMRYLEAVFQYLVVGDLPEGPMGIFDKTHIQFMTHKRLKRWCADAGLTHQKWYDSYDYRFVRRNIYRLLNLCSFGYLRSFTNFEVHGVFRKIS
jgi:2-polyprenyl-3-methyl-5-hydroxy-6-metoxy-1,4-benzoquinol methylase